VDPPSPPLPQKGPVERSWGEYAREREIICKIGESSLRSVFSGLGERAGTDGLTHKQGVESEEQKKIESVRQRLTAR
jgi:hypothetical protein